MTIALLALLTSLTLAPWTGKPLPTASPGATAYRLTVRGAPHASVHLRADGLAPGWIASFCTARLCSPGSYTLPLPSSGLGTIEFQVIRNDDRAPRRTHVVIRTGNGAHTALDVNERLPHRDR